MSDTRAEPVHEPTRRGAQPKGKLPELLLELPESTAVGELQ